MNEVSPDPNECPPLERLSEIAEGLISAESDPELMSHVSSCDACRKELDLARAFHEESGQPEPADLEFVLEKTDETIRTLSRSRGPRVWTRILLIGGSTLSAAAALLLVLDLFVGGPEIVVPGDGPGTFRGNRIELLSPSPEAATLPTELRWEPVPDTEGYDVSIWNGAEELILEESTKDPVLNLPGELLRHASRYYWQVKAIGASGNELARSERQDFLIPVKSDGRLDGENGTIDKTP